jgi:prevent-host-death family protein
VDKRIVSVSGAKTHLSRLLDEVHAGREIVLAKNGKAWARLVPVKPVERRPLGFLRVELPDSFFEPLPEREMAVLEGRYSTPPSALGRRVRGPARARKRGR